MSAPDWLKLTIGDGCEPSIKGPGIESGTLVVGQEYHLLMSTPAREHAEELLGHLKWLRGQIKEHGFPHEGPMLSRTDTLLSKIDTGE